MQLNPNNQGKTYCKKCQTWYESVYKNCVFCGAPNESTVNPVIQAPLANVVNIELNGLISSLSEEAKKRVIQFIKDEL